MFLSPIHALTPGRRRASLIPRRGGRRESRAGGGAESGHPCMRVYLSKGDPRNRAHEAKTGHREIP